MKKKKLDKKTVKQFEKLLLTRKEAINQALNRELDELQEGGRTVMSDDISSSAQDAEQDEINSQLAEVESRELTSIMEALQRIDEGKFGICESCDHQIPSARLHALPYAVRCLPCQREYEKEVYSPSYHRHVED